MRWIRRAVMAYVASQAWKNRDRIKQNVTDLLDGAPTPRETAATTRT